MIQKTLKRGLSISLAMSLVFLSPGTRFYQALGAEIPKTDPMGTPISLPVLPLNPDIGTHLPADNETGQLETVPNSIESVTPTKVIKHRRGNATDHKRRSGDSKVRMKNRPRVQSIRVMDSNRASARKWPFKIRRKVPGFRRNDSEKTDNPSALPAPSPESADLAAAALFDGGLRAKDSTFIPDGAGPPTSPPPAGPLLALPPASPRGPRGVSLFHEDILGFRKVVGPQHDATLKRLPLNAKVPEIINQISRQFHISRARVIELGAKVHLQEDSPVAEWDAVYLGLQRLNAQRFQHFDSQKYHVSFRDIAGLSYAPGWPGFFKRAIEIHKHFFGFFVRFPYHLFDVFILSYFRQNISFTFTHSTEDFLSVTESQDGALVLQVENAEKYFRRVLRETAISGSGETWAARFLASTLGRALRIFGHVAPIPLLAFLRRRLMMAVASAIAMGILGALAPGLAILHLSLIAIPILGPVLTVLANALPILAAATPIFGGVLGPVVLSATQALMHDLVIGPLLNTFILSTIFTLPQSVDQHRQRMESAHPLEGTSWSRALASAALSREFWKMFIKRDFQFFLGLITVGSEIQGILSYGGQIDAGVTPFWHSVTGHDFHAFHSLFSAVEAPKGQSLIPFGGAITWGNLILYKAESALGFNVSDMVMHGLNSHTAGVAAIAVTQTAMQPSKPISFDPDLYKKSPQEVVKRIRELEKSSGNFKAEMKSAQAQTAQLQKELARVQKGEAGLRSRERSLAPAELKAYQESLAKLKAARDERYVRSKLSEIQEMKNPKDTDLAELRWLKEKESQLEQILPRGPENRIGFGDHREIRPGMVKAILKGLDTKTGNSNVNQDPPPSAKVAEIRSLVKEIKTLREGVQAQMEMRDATRKLMEVVAAARQQALKARRNGKGMMSFIQSLSQVSAVMDFTMGLREINSAQNAITGMEGLINQNIQSIDQAQVLSQQNQAAAQQAQANLPQWQNEVTQQTQADQAQQSQLQSDFTKASSAVGTFTGVQGVLPSLLGTIASHEGVGGGGNFDSVAQALESKFQNRLVQLPQVIQWRTNGNPNDSSAFSLKEFQNLLVTVNSNLSAAQSGLSQIQTAPLQAWDLIIRVAPGGPAAPSSISLPDVLNARKAYWESQLQGFQKDLSGVQAMMDPNNQTIVTDEFGRSHPQSLPVWQTQENQVLSQSQSSISNLTSQMDQLSSQISQAGGSSLPTLSGLSLTQLQTTLTSYGTALQNAQVPSNGTTQAFQASLDVVKIATLLPQAAWLVIQASEAQQTVQSIQSAVQNTLPGAVAAMNNAVGMVQSILNDVNADQAFVAQFPNANANPQPSPEQDQALINRKENLLENNIIAPLTAVQGALTNTLIPYQQSAIAQVSSGGAYQQLFSAENSLIAQTQGLNDKTLPWGLISFGGSAGNAQASLASLQSWQTNFASLLQTVNTNKTLVDNRQDPNFTGDETVDYLKDSNYPGGGPLSLPKKITLYTAEMGQRVTEINSQNAQLNGILVKIQTLSNQTLSNVKYNLSAYQLPTNITSNQAGVNAVNALVNNGTLTQLASELNAIASQAGPASSINVGGGSQVQTGTQPSPTISNSQELALMALGAAKLLAPSTQSSAQSPSISYSIARFLYANSTVQSSQSQLATEVPQAEQFLTDAQNALNSATTQLDQDQAYINSGGNSPPTQTVYANQIAMLNALGSVLQEGISFYNLKINNYDPGSLGTVNEVATYYNALANQVYGSSGAGTVDQGNLTAMQSMLTSLQNTMNSLNQTKAELNSWMGQLDNPYNSALRRTSDAISTIQDQTRAVLETNFKWSKLKENLARADEILRADAGMVEDKQAALVADLNETDSQGHDFVDRLPADLVSSIDSLHISQSGWGMGFGSSSGATALVVKKSSFPDFVHNILSSLSGGQAVSSPDIGALGQSILANPQNIAQIIPGAEVMNLGDSEDGFYLVYQTQFGVPYGLSSANEVTLGNVAHVMGSNLSVMAYDTYSPPESPGTGASNAPWGDKGLGVQVETLRKNDVNYFQAIIHHNILDIPASNSFSSQATDSRLLLFDDYALLMMNGKLYVGLSGFGDVAAQNSANQPYYYGANVKTSLKLSEVMSLDADQQALFAKDPRQFFETANLDFTGLDPSLNKTFDIAAQGANKNFHETQIGPKFDVAALLKQAGVVSKTDDNPFTVNLYFANYTGTDDITQKTMGTTILKGFTIYDNASKPQPLVKISNSLTGELGQKYNVGIDQLTVELPQSGIVFSANGQALGPADAYYAQIGEKLNDHSKVSIGYGSPFVGYNNRLSLTFNTSASLSQLWGDVTKSAASDLIGGDALKGYRGEMEDFLKPNQSDKNLGELQMVFAKDIGRRLIEQKIGTLAHDIKDLKSAGAILDNVKVIAQAGFVSGPVSNNPTELAATGGFMTGTETMMTLGKTQKDLLDTKAVSLYKNGLLLQSRLVHLTKEWELDAMGIVENRLDVQRAQFLIQNASSDMERQKANSRMAEASEKLGEAKARYNVLAGNSPDAPTPFDDLNIVDMQHLIEGIRSLLRSPDRFQKIIASLDQNELKKSVGGETSNIMDWIPFVDQFTFGIGTQIQDMMAGQIFGVGGTLRLPFYDPSSKAKNKSYALKSEADIKEMKDIYAQYQLLVENERLEADVWKKTASSFSRSLPQASDHLEFAIKAYRNGLISREEFRRAISLWDMSAKTYAQSESKASMAETWSMMDDSIGGRNRVPAPALDVSDLSQAVDLALKNSAPEALALHQQEFAALAEADNHVTQKFWINLMIGADLTATGTGFLPSFGFTGFPVLPLPEAQFQPQELRELQVSSDKGRSAYYGALETKLKAQTALQIYQDVVAYRSTEKILGELDQNVLPSLQEDLAQARASEDRSAADLAQNKIAQAKLWRDRVSLIHQESYTALNVLLGRPANSPLTININPDQAMGQLKQVLASSDLVQAQRTILKARVQVAEAYQGMVDKDLKVQDISGDPISLIARSVGRLIAALSDEDKGSVDKVVSARLRTLTEQRRLASFDANLARSRSRAQIRLQMIESEIEKLSSHNDSESVAMKDQLSTEQKTIAAELLSLGVGPDHGSAPVPPASFADLRGRLMDKEEQISRTPQESSAPRVPAPGFDKTPAEFFVRYFYARQTLDENPINHGFLEPWIELRLKNQDTPQEDLLALSRLAKDKAERLDHIARERSAGQADALLSSFKANVHFLNWSEAQAAKARTAKEKAMWDPEIQKIRGKALLQSEEIWSILGLDSQTPGIQNAADRLKALSRLLPEENSGGGNPENIGAGAFVDGDRLLRSFERQDRIRKILGESVFASAIGEDSFMSQIKSDVIARHMSYEGVTPIAAFGMFRGTDIFGGFLQAPDPQEIERGLSNILSDSIREELESQGKLKELEMTLYTQMARVSGGMGELQADGDLIAASERDLEAREGLAKLDPASLDKQRDVLKAKENLIEAWGHLMDQSADLKSNFVSLVAELKALGQKEGELPPSQHLKNLRIGNDRLSGSLIPSFNNNEKSRGLISYWADRMEDPDFVSRQDHYLDEQGVPAQLKEAIDADAALYRTALKDAQAASVENFSDQERISLLSKNDARGKRNTLMLGLSALKQIIEKSDPQLDFLRRDLERELTQSTQKRDEYSQAALDLRNAYWNAVPASPQVKAAFKLVESDHQALVVAREALVDEYLSSSLKSQEFLLKDEFLDRYLKAQQSFDEDLIKTLGLKEVRSDVELLRTLDALYDAQSTLNRQIDFKEAGRGVLALDALILLQKSRLFAARWQGRSSETIKNIAGQIEKLEDQKKDWLSHGSQLYPIYVKTRVDKSGQRLWAIDQWWSAEKLRRRLITQNPDKKVIRTPDGRFVLEKDPSIEIVGGLDALNADKASTQASIEGVKKDIQLADRLNHNDFALNRPIAGSSIEGYSVQELLGPSGLLGQGKLLFFEAPKAQEESDRLHYRLPALAAWARSPKDYAIYVYAGSGAAPSSDQFATLESLEASSRKGDFYRLSLSAHGAQDLERFFEARRQAELRAGYVELKLSGYGFARDGQGEVSEIYLNQDDFNAAQEAMKDAKPSLENTLAQLNQAKKDKAESESREKVAQKKMEDATAAFNGTEGRLKNEIQERVQKDFPRKDKESDIDYANRLEDETKKELVSNSDYKKTQEILAAQSKVLNSARADLKLKVARLASSERSVKDARLTLSRSKTWSLYKSGDLILGLDSQGSVVHAQASPVYGKSVLDDRVSDERSTLYVRGPIYAAVVDSDGRLRRYYENESDTEKAAKSWVLKSKTIDGEKRVYSEKDGALNPTLRISHYEASVGNETLPVLLNQRYLEESAKDVASHMPFKKYWGVMPWRWGSLIMEVPREVVGFPMEWAGRNPNSESYLGRASMYKTEGGETIHHGFFRKIAGAVDVLNFLPDPVTPYYDLSQFPKDLRAGPQIEPGQSEASLSPELKDKNVHFGVKFLKRLARYYQEDLNAARLRTLAHFNGGVSEMVISEMQGRAGAYEESRKDGGLGEEALAKTLSDREIALLPQSDGSSPIVLSGKPDDVWVNRAQKTIEIDAGAKEYQTASGEMKDYSDQIEKNLSANKTQLPRLEKERLDRRRRVIEAEAQNTRSKAEEDRLQSDVYDRELRVLSQQDADQRMKADDSQSRAIRRELLWWGKYIRKLRQDAPSQTQVSSLKPLNVFWIKMMAYLGAMAGIIHWIFRRKKHHRNDI